MTTGSSHDGASRRASKIGNRKRTLRLASEIVLNDHIDIKGKPCRVSFRFSLILSLSLLFILLTIHIALDLDLISDDSKSLVVYLEFVWLHLIFLDL